MFSDDGQRELERLPLHAGEDGVFHGRLEGAGPGLVYGFRAHGRYQPESGEGPYWQEFKVDLDPDLSVLDGLLQVRDRQDGTADRGDDDVVTPVRPRR